MPTRKTGDSDAAQQQMQMNPNGHSTLVLHEGDPAGLPVVVGCPFRVGTNGWKGKRATIEFRDGTRAPAQCHALNVADPGGVQWVELSFFSFAAGPARVILDETGAVGSDTARVTATAAGVVLSNEHIRIVACKASPHHPLRFEMKNRQSGEWGQFGTLRPEVLTDNGLATVNANGEDRKIRILREGPLRTQVELKGHLATVKGAPSLQYRLTVELWMGLNSVRVDWMLAHEVPGVDSVPVKCASLVGNWTVGDNPQRVFVQTQHGPYGKRRLVKNPASVAIDADFSCGPAHVADPSMLLDETDYPFYLAPPKIATEPWLGLAGSCAAVYVQVLDFCESRPNRLQSRGSELTYHLIPDTFPTQWPQGRRREQSCVFTFVSATGDSDPQSPYRALKAMHYASRAQPSPETLVELDRFEMPVALGHGDGRNVRLNSIFHRLCRLDTPGDKWNLGDTIDSGYTRTYAGVPNRLERLEGAPPMRFQFTAGTSHFALWPESAAALIEPVWANNEYDVIHALAQETFRTGRPDHLQMLRWASRHTIEVDFLSFSDHRWHHRACVTHSAHHTTTGAHPSHFWTQGLLQYYLLSGDRDALEVALALGDKTIENLGEPDVHPLGFNRELGWGLLSLVCLVEATRIERYLEAAHKIASFLQRYDRRTHTAKVQLSLGNAAHSLERQMIDNCFGYASMVEAMDRYQKLTGSAATADWLVELLHQLRLESWNAIEEGKVPPLSFMVPLVMAIGYERTGDRDFLNVGLVILEVTLAGASMDRGHGHRGMFSGETKMSAMCCRALGRFLGLADRAGLLASYEYPSVAARMQQRHAPVANRTPHKPHA